MRRFLPFFLFLFSVCCLFGPATGFSKTADTKISADLLLKKELNQEWKSSAKKIVTILDINGTAGLIIRCRKIMGSINASKPSSSNTKQLAGSLIFLCTAAEALKVNAEMICNGEGLPAGLAELMCDTFTNDYEVSEQLEKYCLAHINNAGVQKKKLFKKARDIFIVEYSSIGRPKGN